MAAYTVSTNAMLAAGRHNYQTLTNGRDRAEGGSQYEVIRKWFGKNSIVSPPALGRIERAKK